MICSPRITRAAKSRVVPGIVALVALAGLVAAKPAYADAAGSARQAVELQSIEHGSRIRVTFVEHQVRDLRGDEREVTGRGYYIPSDSSDRHNFDYTVRVNVSTSDTWNLSIRMHGIDRGKGPEHGRL